MKKLLFALALLARVSAHGQGSHDIKAWKACPECKRYQIAYVKELDNPKNHGSMFTYDFYKVSRVYDAYYHCCINKYSPDSYVYGCISYVCAECRNEYYSMLKAVNSQNLSLKVKSDLADSCKKKFYDCQEKHWPFINALNDDPGEDDSNDEPGK